MSLPIPAIGNLNASLFVPLSALEKLRAVYLDGSVDP